MPKSTIAILARALALGEKRGIRVCPTVRVDREPQYRFIALVAAMPIENTTTTRTAMPLVRVVRPPMTLSPPTARPITAEGGDAARRAVYPPRSGGGEPVSRGMYRE